MGLYSQMRRRRGGRVVDGSGLENRHTRKGIGGSNPSLSARFSTLLFPDHQTERPSSDAVMTSALLRITSPNLFGPTIREFRPIDDDRSKPEPVPRLSARGFRHGSPFLRRLRSHATCIFQDPSRTSTRPYLLALSPFRLAKPRTGNARSCKATEKITRAGIDIS